MNWGGLAAIRMLHRCAGSRIFTASLAPMAAALPVDDRHTDFFLPHFLYASHMMLLFKSHFILPPGFRQCLFLLPMRLACPAGDSS